MTRRTILKLLILFFIVTIRTIPATKAYYNDVKTLDSSEIRTGCWNAPTIPLLTIENYIGIGLSQTLSFTESISSCSENINYEVNIANDPNFVDHNSIYLNINQTSFVHMFPHLGNYYWRVRSCSGIKCSNWSTTGYIRLLNKPKNNTNEKDSILFQEQPISFNVQYEMNSNSVLLEVANIPVIFKDSEQPIEYLIKYKANGNEQGIYGKIYPTNVTSNSAKIKLYLGTCSKATCTPHVIDESRIYLSTNGAEYCYTI